MKDKILTSRYGKRKEKPAPTPVEEPVIKHLLGNWEFNLDKKMLIICPKALKMLALSPVQKLTVKDFFFLVDKQQIDNLKNWIRLIHQNGEAEAVQLKLRTRYTTEIWIKLSAFRYRGNRNIPSMVLGVVEDVTQKVDEERVALSIVNHEMRTPLSVIKLYAQMIRRTKTESHKPLYAELASKIERQIEGLTNMLDHYLSRADERGKISKLNLSVFNLDVLIDQTLIDMRQLHPNHTFTKITTGSCMVNADRYLIMQVLINYLTNAVKFSPEHSIIEVYTRLRGNKVEVSVADQGPGITQGEEKKIFGLFYKIPADHNPYGGTSKGLGLHLVAQIIAKHRGKYWVENSQIKGSVFYFTLTQFIN